LFDKTLKIVPDALWIRIAFAAYDFYNIFPGHPSLQQFQDPTSNRVGRVHHSSLYIHNDSPVLAKH
jgi:hypothetical protein